MSKNGLHFNAGLGIAVRECGSCVEPADYAPFADRQPLGVADAKPDGRGER